MPSSASLGAEAMISRNTSCLTSRRSTTVSMTTSTPSQACAIDVPVLTRPRTSSGVAPPSRSLAASFSRLARIDPSAASPLDGSLSTTADLVPGHRAHLRDTRTHRPSSNDRNLHHVPPRSSLRYNRCAMFTHVTWPLPPTLWVRPVRAPWTWRSPASPRSCQKISHKLRDAGRADRVTLGQETAARVARQRSAEARAHPSAATPRHRRVRRIRDPRRPASRPP